MEVIFFLHIPGRKHARERAKDLDWFYYSYTSSVLLKVMIFLQKVVNTNCSLSSWDESVGPQMLPLRTTGQSTLSSSLSL